MKLNTIYNEDCLLGMKKLPDNSVDAVVTDPPYHLTQVSRNGSPRTNDPATPFGRTRLGAKGFMGKTWDGGDIAHNSELWCEVFRLLKPGGHLLSFGGSRTYHRMASAIEDAGFEIRDQLMWIYGSGFPKSKNIGNGFGTALKPAHEPIVLARKPLGEGTVAANVIKHGTGGINIDGCRTNLGEVIAGGGRNFDAYRSGEGRTDRPPNHRQAQEAHANGRWPANVIFDEEAGALLDEQSGQLSNCGGPKRTTHDAGMFGIGTPGTIYRDSGGASRFFYCAKASQKERGQGNNHPTVKPIKLMEYLVRLITPLGGIVLEPFVGSGTTILACISEDRQYIGFEKDKPYFKMAQKRIAEHSSELASVA